MPPKDKLAKQLADLRELGSGELSDQLKESLRNALSNKSNHLIARAAEIAADHNLIELEPELLAVFEQLMIDPIKRDPGCVAKIAILGSLRRMDLSVEDFYLKAIHHKQLEPVYGGRVDCAAKLRAEAALGLIQSSYLDLMVELADLLADPEVDARLGAARAIGFTSNEASVPLLRFKVKTGDEDARVINACFESLIKLDPDRSLALVGNYILDENPALAEAAAFALGESGHSEAYRFLRQGWYGNEEVSTGRAILMAMALLRSDRAFDFLLAVLEEAPLYQAVHCLEALEMVRYDRQLWIKVSEVVERRGEERLLNILSN